MRFGLLGPLTVWSSAGAPVTVPGRKVRALLADLLVHAPRPVSADRLIDDIWADEPPAKATGALQAKVSQLRGVLERAEPGGRDRLVFRLPGYVLDVEADEVDSCRFAVLTGQARATDDPRSRVTLLTDALALWRGPALADVSDQPFARATVARLEDERLVAVEELVEARLALGEHDAVAAELTELVAQHPLRERLRATYMRALYRAGRQSEAVNSYAALRHRLVEEQGLDPSPELVALHVAILNHDPALEAEPRAPGPSVHESRYNLPRPLTRLVGRDDAVAEVCQRLQSERLVTLTGSGGVGKTRLATATAGEVVVAFTDGVCLVELASLVPLAPPGDGGDRHAAAAVAEAVMAALGIRDAAASRTTVVDRLAAALSTRQLLLLLDNCEPVIDGVARLVGGLLAAAPGLHVLATSQVPLGLAGEVVWSVPPLGPSGAMQLFVERATGAAPGFALDDGNRPTVDAICRRLDGIPLALELAATRVRALGVDEVASRLDDRFRLLSSGYRRAPARQQTLRATIDWSWDLLTVPDRALLRRLAVYEGWALDAVDDVDGLARLVDRSLVTVVDRTDGLRYRLLESVAAYGIERLREAGELADVQERHNHHYTELAEQADTGVRGHDQRRWLNRLDQESANLRRVLDDACQRGDAALALRLVNATGWYLFLRGRLGEARRWVDHALAAAAAATDVDAAAVARATAWRASVRLLTGDGADPTSAPPRFDDIDDPGERARAEWLLGFAESDWGQMATSESLVTRALASCKDRGDDWGVAAALSTQAKQAYSRGEFDAVGRAGEQSLTLFRALGDQWGQLQAMEWLGALAQLTGDHERAIDLHSHALNIAQELGLWPQAADQLSWLGQIGTRLGDHHGALAMHKEARQLAAEHSYKPGETFAEIGLGCAARQAGDVDLAEKALTNVLTALRHSDHGTGVADTIVLTELGFIAELRGDADAARTFHEEGLTTARRLGDQRSLARALEGLAGAETLTGHHYQAARLLGQAARARESAAVPSSPAERSDIERITACARAILGESTFATEHDST